MRERSFGCWRGLLYMAMMQILELNCGSMCPIGGHLMTGAGGLLRGHMIARVWVVETNAGLVLVDAGFGSEDKRRLPSPFRWITGPKLDPKETALHQLTARGYKPSDVRHIILTHMDLDHAGGMGDFPQAQIHVHKNEHAAAMKRANLREQQRYLPSQWAHHPHFVLHNEAGETWKGFASVKPVPGTGDELLLLPTHGHTRGHCAVAVRSEGKWWVHAGDALFHHGALHNPSRQPWGLAAFEQLIAEDNSARAHNLRRLRDLHRDSDVQVISAHDPSPSGLLRAS